MTQQQPPDLRAIEGTVETEPLTVGGFEDIDRFFDDTLTLPLGGVLYTIRGADAELGLMCQRLMAVGARAMSGRKVDEDEVASLDDEAEHNLFKRLLGGDEEHPNYDPEHDVWAALFANGANWERIKHVGTTAMIWTAYDKAAAEEFWKTGGRPKATPQPRQPQDRKGSGKSARPASRAGTTTTKAKRKRATPGQKSSATGD